MDRPLLICMSATRNYGWVTRAFCQANSQWADYIIIVDQMSTDDTRAICAEYPKVIILDDHDMSYSETRRCTMALNRARQIKGDKILVYLAIDEVLPANWMDTEDGKKILRSKPTDMFLFDWANLLPDNKHYMDSRGDNMYRAFNDDGITPYDNQNKDMHTQCLPYHEGANEHIVSDFQILHFGFYNIKWSYVKHHYYQMVELDKNHRSAVTLGRFYYYAQKNNVGYEAYPEIQSDWLWKKFDIFSLVDVDSVPPLVEESKNLLCKNGVEHYAKLDIWDEPFITYLGISDPRKCWMKVLHKYLHVTMKYKNILLIRVLDKGLKRII